MSGLLRSYLEFKRLRWEQGRPETAVYVCAENGCVIEEGHKTSMLASGSWLATNLAPEDQDAIGFHLNSLYSPVGWMSWADIARAWEAAQGKPELLKEFVNTVEGRTWEEPGEALEWRRLYDRREPYRLGSVPEGAVKLTAGADVQRDRIEVDVWGWGLNREQWLVEHIVVPGAPNMPEPWERMDELVEQRFEHPSGAEMKIDRLAIDTGDGAFTQEVYRWAAKHRLGGVVMPIKGVASFNRTTPVEGPTYVQAQRNGKKVKRGVAVWTVAVDTFKSDLHGRLLLDPPTDEEKTSGASYPAGYVHVPVGVADEWFKQLTAERKQRVVNKRTKRSRLEWAKTRDRNEALDMAVYAAAAAWNLGLERWSEKKWQAEIEKRGLELPSGAAPAPAEQSETRYLRPPSPAQLEAEGGHELGGEAPLYQVRVARIEREREAQGLVRLGLPSLTSGLFPAARSALGRVRGGGRAFLCSVGGKPVLGCTTASASLARLTRFDATARPWASMPCSWNTCLARSMPRTAIVMDPLPILTAAQQAAREGGVQSVNPG